MESTWNPWHGCRKYSEGCKNCYVYRSDAAHGRDAFEIGKNADFNLPISKNRLGEYKIPDGAKLFTCFTSDFFLEEADIWRDDAWKIMKRRPQVNFIFFTKRIERFYDCIPEDWTESFRNVTICCTVENQKQADIRLPIYINAPLVYRVVICEPLLGYIDISRFLSNVDEVVAGGESGSSARECRFEWLTDLQRQCKKSGTAFSFHQTGARFIKDGRLYDIPRRKQHSQAKRAALDYLGTKGFII